MTTCALASFVASNGGMVTVHGRTFTVVDIRSVRDIGWSATFQSRRAQYTAMQTVPPRLPQAPEYERWFVLLGARALHFAVKHDDLRDLR